MKQAAFASPSADWHPPSSNWHRSQRLRANQILCDAALQDRLKDASQDIALAETAMPVHREGGIDAKRTLAEQSPISARQQARRS
jgi:hypothetical protein